MAVFFLIIPQSEFTALESRDAASTRHDPSTSRCLRGLAVLVRKQITQIMATNDGSSQYRNKDPH